jgi:WD40 repeat protein
MLSFLGRGASGGEEGASAPRPPSHEDASVDLASAPALDLTLEATLSGHTDRVWSVAWEPQGRTLATCSSDKTVRLWAPSRAAGGAWVTVAELEGVHTRTVRQVAWSPCGTRVPYPRRTRDERQT